MILPSAFQHNIICNDLWPPIALLIMDVLLTLNLVTITVVPQLLDFSVILMSIQLSMVSTHQVLLWTTPGYK
ncbi:hypothetical protein C0J52_06960 [Blattella germanica]|nr:hypothetical protein C0J52_06960 [Blattella germanica]